MKIQVILSIFIFCLVYCYDDYNNDYNIDSDVKPTKSVKECYYCAQENMNCKEPGERRDCDPNNSSSIIWMCWTMTKMKTKDHTKGCIENNDDNKIKCDFMDNELDTKCRTCEEDLCNAAGLGSGNEMNFCLFHYLLLCTPLLILSILH